ncbi:hypothetical protein [Sulfurospirillum sp. 1612]|uniref:hypothetical protein n=1 Tax=Sulfurospirillum sp. 1612 TaxID=3094835 RepID=UPI002F95DABE
MKIALMCQSLLLSKSLELFLKNKITTYKKCDFVITDKQLELDKPQFIIAHHDAHLGMPFSESSLIIALEKFYNTNILNLAASKEEPRVPEDDLKDKIDEITTKFRNDLISIIAQHYEK